MADTVAVESPNIINVPRNNVEFPFIETRYARGEKKTAGKTYLRPDSDKSKLQKLREWLGDELEHSILIRVISTKAQGWTEEASKDENDNEVALNVDNFIKYASEFSARGEPIAELKAEVLRLAAFVTEQDENGKSLRTEEELMTAFASIRSLNQEIARKSRKTTDEVAATAEAA